MINAISSSIGTPYPVTGTAELATLQKELVSYDKQLAGVQSGTVQAGPVQTQLLAAQVSLLTAQIVSLSGVTPVSFTQPLGATGQPVAAAPVGSAAPVAAPVATVTAALSQAQATLSAIFEKVSVQGTSPPAATGQTAGTSVPTANPTTTTPALNNPPAGNVAVGSTINVTV